jgi:hypothetical protein
MLPFQILACGTDTNQRRTDEKTGKSEDFPGSQVEGKGNVASETLGGIGHYVRVVVFMHNGGPPMDRSLMLA